MQILPVVLGEMLNDPDLIKVAKSYAGNASNKKIDIAGLKKASDKK
ncbi:MAG: hypothetical protein HZC48_03155 [Nitrospirae bacterium]|nr:hypothetical protein [Nitrospirota bacterium]